MKIVARINREDPGLVHSMQSRGVTAKLVRGGIIIELPPMKEANSFAIPVEAMYPVEQLFIDCEESGGGYTNTGSATVVCGASGKALKPYRVPRGGHLACGTHAHFSVPRSVITVTATKGESSLSIVKHSVGLVNRVHYDAFAILVSQSLWNGEAPPIEWHCPEWGITTDRPYHPVFEDLDDWETCDGTFIPIKLELPELYNRFQAAALAARTKAECYHCRHVHYALTS